MPLNASVVAVQESHGLLRCADSRPSLFLQAERQAAGNAVDRFSSLLAEVDGLPEQIENVPDLFRRLFRTARHEKFIAVIDEFPWLLETTRTLENGPFLEFRL